VTDRSAIHSTFVLERTYDASPARVFQAFENPEAKNRWFVGGDGWGTDAYQADFRVGGYEIYRGNHEGMVVSMESRYFDIVPNERIVFAYDMHFGDSRISVSLTTIELMPAGTGTRLVFTEHDTFLDGHEQPGPREEGTKQLLGALDAELRNHVTTDR
jgi:uncharacterized protein YndB with AHSA1/START domain